MQFQASELCANIGASFTLRTSPFERSRFAADAFACQVAAVCVKE